MKDHLPKTGIVPPKEKGRNSSVEAHVDCATREEAIAVYQEARRRLLDINRWDIYAGTGSAVFSLTDTAGNAVSHSPEMGDLIKIQLPGSARYDWVEIEEYVETIDRQRDNDLFAFRVRPTKAPDAKGDAPTHFFTEDATSTFLIQRVGNKVTAAEKGRNEIPNHEGEKFFDKVRNLIVGASASFGLSVPQWEALILGILQKEE